jgi:hypothetical protein
LARRLAEEFNEKLYKIPRVDKATQSRVEFLVVPIYQLDTRSKIDLSSVSWLRRTSVKINGRTGTNITNGSREWIVLQCMIRAPMYTRESLRHAITKLVDADRREVNETSEEEEEGDDGYNKE